MRDELPSRKHSVKCGIMNLNESNQIGSHWVCFVRNKKDRIYFDTFGQITPLELQKSWRHKQTCQVLRNKKQNVVDAIGVNEENSQQTSKKLETIPKKRSRRECQECSNTYASRQSLYNHK